MLWFTVPVSQSVSQSVSQLVNQAVNRSDSQSLLVLLLFITAIITTTTNTTTTTRWMTTASSLSEKVLRLNWRPRKRGSQFGRDYSDAWEQGTLDVSVSQSVS